MRNVIAILLAFILVGCATTNQQNNYIRTTGYGKTFEDAKKEAFSLAIEQYIGTVVLSERESNSKDLVKNDILQYSSGYVDDFKIVEVEQGSTFKVTVDVKVASSRIAERILAKSTTSKQFEGDKHYNQYNSYLDQRQKGDRLMRAIMNDYPIRAYNIEQKPHTIKLDGYRNMVITIPYKLSWNYNYLAAWREGMDLTQDTNPSLLKRGGPVRVTIMVKDPDDFILGKMTHHDFSDFNLFDSMVRSIVGNNEVRFLVSVYDMSGQVIAKTCQAPKFISGSSKGFYSIGEQNHLIIFGNQKEEGDIKLSVGQNSYLYTMLNTTNKIQLQIVKQSTC